jgi:hypothetical protein
MAGNFSVRYCSTKHSCCKLQHFSKGPPSGHVRARSDPARSLSDLAPPPLVPVAPLSPCLITGPPPLPPPAGMVDVAPQPPTPNHLSAALDRAAMGPTHPVVEETYHFKRCLQKLLQRQNNY